MKRSADGASKRDAELQARQLNGKVIIVTGSTQGQGAEIARMAAALGAQALVICGKPPCEAQGQKVVAEMEALGAECLFVPCDANSPADCAAVVAAADARFGRIDGLVNCAGDTRRGDLESTDVALWDELVDVNLRSHFLFTQAVSRVMKRERTRGSIVNISSVQSHGGLTFCMAYACAKAGLNCLTKNNAAELGPHGIRVNSVNMGWCATENEHALQARDGGGDGWLDAADASVPLGRICRPADIAHAVSFLLSDAAFTTGACMDMHPEFILGPCAGIGKASDLV